jgi:hypothetical protein
MTGHIPAIDSGCIHNPPGSSQQLVYRSNRTNFVANFQAESGKAAWLHMNEITGVEYHTIRFAMSSIIKISYFSGANYRVCRRAFAGLAPFYRNQLYKVVNEMGTRAFWRRAFGGRLYHQQLFLFQRKESIRSIFVVAINDNLN